MSRIHEFFGQAKSTYEEWRDDDAQTWAASVAFYTIFSLAPLLVLAVAIAGIIFGRAAAQGQLAGQMQSMVGDAGAEVVQSAIADASGPGGGSVIATIVSLALLFVGASKVFAELQKALNHIWDVHADPDQGWRGALRARLAGFAMVVGVGVVLMVAVAASMVLSGLEQLVGVSTLGPWFWEAVNFVVSFVVLGVLFALLFKYVPDVHITWADVRVGAATTAILFGLGKWALGLYLSHASPGSTYGAASSLVVLLAWIYYSSQIFFFGAEYTQVHAHRRGRSIEPDEHAVRDDTPEMPHGARPSAG